MNTATTETAALVGEALREAERSSKWTAEKAGIPISTFRRKINGHGDFTVGEISRIAAVLKVTPCKLLPADFYAEQQRAS